MAELLTLASILGIVSIILQIIAAYFAYQLIKITGAFRAWILIISALIVMTIRRITAELITTGYISALTGTAAWIDRIILPLVISILLVFGMYDLLRLFKNHNKMVNN